MEKQTQSLPPAQLPKYPHIAIAILSSGTHVGLLYRLVDNSPRFLHLAGHLRLLDQAWDGSGYAWFECIGFENAEARDFASWLQKIHRSNADRVRYGFNYWPGACFDSDGSWNPSAEGIGLTCATFVMDMFHSYGYPILDASTWKPRSSDCEFFSFVLDHLASHQAPAGYVQSQRDALAVAVRFHPLEVASCAARFDSEPIKFEQAISMANRMERELAARRGPWAIDGSVLAD